MSSRRRAKIESRKNGPGLSDGSGSSGGEARLEREAAASARKAVSGLVRSDRGSLSGPDLLGAAVGTVVSAVALALLESQRGVPGGLGRLLEKKGGRTARAGRLWGLLREAVEKEPLLGGEPFGSGLVSLLETEPSQGAAESLLCLLELVRSASLGVDVWASTRLLGVIYEASLGWELAPGGLHQTSGRVKSQGAVYTPRAVARFIVEGTLRPLLSACESPGDLEGLSVCDPACGGGAFLLEAMRLLEEEALRRGWLADGLPERLGWRRKVVSGGLNGVDIDPGAVQVSRLALWAASGGGREAAQALGRSIIVGDSLVGAWRADLAPVAGGCEADPAGLRPSLDAWCERLFPSGGRGGFVHWELDFPRRFGPDVEGPGGWDAVVGNPPYLGARSLRPMGAYLKARFAETYTGYNDLSAFFLHRGMELLRPGGRLGFITPAYWFQNTFGEKLRRYLLKEGRLEEVCDFGPSQVFPGRGVHTAVVFLEKGSRRGSTRRRVRYRRLEPGELERPGEGFERDADLVPLRSLKPGRWVFASGEVDAVLRKARQAARPLGELFRIEKGPTSGCNGVFTLNGEEESYQYIEKELLRPCIKGGDVRRYGPLKPRRWLLYLDKEVDMDLYPGARLYLEAHRARLESRNEARRGLYPWWRLERPRRRALFEAPAKLVVPYRAPENRFTLDEAGCFNDGGDIRALVPRAWVGRETMLAALAVANSSAGNLIYRCLGKPKGRMLEFFVRPLSEAPLGPPPSADSVRAGAYMAELAAFLEGEGPEALARWLAGREDGYGLITPALALLAEMRLRLEREGREGLSGREAAPVERAVDTLVGRLMGLTAEEKAHAARAARASG